MDPSCRQNYIITYPGVHRPGICYDILLLGLCKVYRWFTEKLIIKILAICHHVIPLTLRQKGNTKDRTITRQSKQ
jgi:hypothetical protein